MDKFFDSATTVLIAIITVAMVAVLVSQRAQTSTVVGTTFTGLTGFLSAATAPVTGF